MAGERMLITDDRHALMDQETFDVLPEYSCSIPTGVVVGKLWKRREPYLTDPAPWSLLKPNVDPTKWYLGEYAECDPPLPDKVAILWREILLA